MHLFERTELPLIRLELSKCKRFASKNMDAAARNMLSVVPLQNFRANGSLAISWIIMMVSNSVQLRSGAHFKATIKQIDETRQPQSQLKSIFFQSFSLFLKGLGTSPHHGNVQKKVRHRCITDITLSQDEEHLDVCQSLDSALRHGWSSATLTLSVILGRHLKPR